MIREVLTFGDLTRLGPEEAAALLFVRQDSDGGAVDDVLLDEWLAADAAHIEAWVRTCGVWQLVGNASAGNGSLQALRGSAKPTRSPGRWRLSLAASIAALAVAGGAAFLNMRQDFRPDRGSAKVAQASIEKRFLVTAKGQRQRFVLADTSAVTLNTDSAASVAFRPGGERRVDLVRGQAFFEVAHDASRPFVVGVGDRTVTAVGTAFEVRVDDDRMKVVLVQGRVSVGRAAETPVALHAGQQLLASGTRINISPADLSAVGDWQRGVVTFEGTTLSAAAAELNRYSKMQLVVDDPVASRLTISGVFRTDDARRFARTIEQIYPVEIIVGNDETIRIVATKRAQ